ncbi:MAG: cytochrome c biogenesis heme-transporting ATPase CcmA [Gammaproteobacteria bacterium]
MKSADPTIPNPAASAPHHRLEAVDLECRRGDRRLITHLNFGVDSKTLLHVRGPNGCGKTTLLRAMCGLFEPQEGEIRWNGEGIRKLGDEFRKEVLYLGHLNGIKNELTALENLRVGATLDGDRVEEDQVWYALKRIGLAGFEDLPTKVLSQGQKKRVALSRLLLSSAPLWILDEPFVALDVGAVELLQALIAEHVEQGGMAVITTHQEVALTSGQIQVLDLGG